MGVGFYKCADVIVGIFSVRIIRGDKQNFFLRFFCGGSIAEKGEEKEYSKRERKRRQKKASKIREF